MLQTIYNVLSKAYSPRRIYPQVVLYGTKESIRPP